MSTRNGKRYREGSLSSTSRKIKKQLKIKSMVLTINSHGNVMVDLRDMPELKEFEEIVSDDEDNYSVGETLIFMDNEQDPPVEKIGGPIVYEKDDETYIPYMWIADVIPVPENVNFYAVNVPCAVGYRTPDRREDCWHGLCKQEQFIEWENQLTPANLRSEMCMLSHHYNHGISEQIIDELDYAAIHSHSIRQNTCFTPIKKILQKPLETQETDDEYANILLHIFTEDGKTTYTLLDIFDATKEIDFPELKKDYPRCRTQITKYIQKIKHDIRLEDNANLLSLNLSHILQLLFSLVDKYGDNTDIYMIDHSCFELAFLHSAEGTVKKNIYSKLTQHFTSRPEQIYLGGKRRRKRRGLK